MTAVNVLILLLVTALPLGAGAYDVLINVTGTIVTNACSISPASQNMTVELGKYTTNHFSGVGSTSDAVPFFINIEGCAVDVVSKARVRFSGKSDYENSELLAPDGGSGPGIAIRLLDKNKQKMVLGEWGSTEYGLGSGRGDALLFYAQYEAVSDTVTAGAVDATSTFLVEYE